MGLAELYLAPGAGVFAGTSSSLEKAFAIVIGAPFDATVSYRAGAREGPRAIREASANIEFYSLRAGMDVDRVPVHDAGDVAVHADPVEYSRRLASVVRELRGTGKPIVVLGGEHTVSYGILQGMKADDPCILVFDAHFDLRDEYLGLRLGHATVMRRLVEQYGPDHVYYVGVRAFAEEELSYVRSKAIRFLTPPQVQAIGTREAVRRIHSWLERADCKSLYISFDMDVYDPGQAPGVSNPEPEGPEAWRVLDILYYAASGSPKPLVGIDVVEHTPVYDCGGATSVLAAKTVVEWLAAAYRRQSSTGRG